MPSPTDSGDDGRDPSDRSTPATEGTEPVRETISAPEVSSAACDPRAPLERLPTRASTHAALRLGRTRIRSGGRCGNYRLGKPIGQGGMGIVFEATAPHMQNPVALKVMRQGALATPAEMRRFEFEIEAMSMLSHPNIMPVLHVGRFNGHLYFTMPRMRGGSLASLIDSWLRLAPAEQPSYVARARLLARVARGVEHAQKHGLLHRDVKPANILLDEHGVPLVADFGLSRVIGARDTRSETQAGGGTLPYMSPEHISVGAWQLDEAADVYSLGAVLYEMLTFKVPFYESAPEKLRERILSPEPPTPPRDIEPLVPAALESVCLKALEKSKERRYATAAQLAEDLESIAAGRPPAILPLSRLERAWHWVRRNPQRARRIAWSGASLVALIVLMSVWWRDAVRERQTALETNAFIASAQAGATLFQLREFADRVQLAAEDGVFADLAGGELNADPPFAVKRLAEGFDAVFVLSTDGRVKAQWPLPPINIWNRTYEFRDYFRGARELGYRNSRAAYVARAFRSERDNELKFGVSTPLYTGGRWVGVLTAVVAADSVFGKVRRQEPNGDIRVTLLGPRDLERGQPESLRSSARFVFVVHDKLHRGQEVAAPALPFLRAAFDNMAPGEQQFALRYASPQRELDYRDPLFDGSFRAAFAPVGGTGYVVAVQTPVNTWGNRLRELVERLY